MTEAWKSNKMHWCDVCKCWLNDTKAAIAHHEQGMGHKANLARKIREMTKKADEERRVKAETARSLSNIEEQARKKYEADRRAQLEAEEAAARAAEARNGKWVWDESCSYYYNEVHRWYYDPKTKWYYGASATSDTPEWAEKPPIPAAALFGTAKHEGGPVPQPQPPKPAGATTGASTSKPAAAAAGAGAGDAPVNVKVQKQVIELPKHPLMNVGGHQSHHAIGRIGAAKLGLSGSSAPASSAPADKRKRDEPAGGGKQKELTPEEAEFMKRREAARQRVAQRTAQNFGFI